MPPKDLVAVHIGYAKDELGFRCSVMEHPITGKRYLAYAPDVWWERQRHISLLEAMSKSVPRDDPQRVSVEVS